MLICNTEKVWANLECRSDLFSSTVVPSNTVYHFQSLFFFGKKHCLFNSDHLPRTCVLEFSVVLNLILREEVLQNIWCKLPLRRIIPDAVKHLSVSWQIWLHGIGVTKRPPLSPMLFAVFAYCIMTGNMSLSARHFT